VASTFKQDSTAAIIFVKKLSRRNGPVTLGEGLMGCGEDGGGGGIFFWVVGFSKQKVPGGGGKIYKSII